MDSAYSNETCNKDQWERGLGENRLCNGILRHVQVAVIVTLILLILIGNGLNLIIIALTKSLRSPHGYLLTSLTCADLGLGVSPSLSIYPAIRHSGWPHSCTVCLVMAFSSHIFFTVSAMMLASLSLERYIAIVHPLKYCRLLTKKAALITILISWVTGVLLSLPAFVENFVGFEYVPETYYCMLHYNKSMAYTAIVFFSLDLPYMLTVIVTSAKVCKSLIKRKCQQVLLIRPSAIVNSHSMGENSEMRRHASGKRSKHTAKLFRMTTSMAVAGCNCFNQYAIITTLVRVLEAGLVPSLFMFLSHWLLVANSFINVIIYFVMNQTFRDRGVELLQTVVSQLHIRVYINVLLGERRNAIDTVS